MVITGMQIADRSPAFVSRDGESTVKLKARTAAQLHESRREERLHGREHADVGPLGCDTAWTCR
jgi:hypothetical protein